MTNVRMWSMNAVAGINEVKPVSAFDQLKSLTATTASRFATGSTDASKPVKAGKVGQRMATPTEVRKVLPFLEVYRQQESLSVDEFGKLLHAVNDKLPAVQRASIIQDNEGNWMVSHAARMPNAVAAYLLVNNNKHGKNGNRPMSAPLVKSYTEDKQAGVWRNAANALTFVGADCTIGDAQHTLKSDVEAGYEGVYIVTYGITEEGAKYINGGKPRSTKDEVAREGWFDWLREDMMRNAENLDKDGKLKSTNETYIKSLESVFSESVRILTLREVGSSVRDSTPQIKKKHYFSKRKELYSGCTVAVVAVADCNKATRGMGKPNAKTGKTSQTGKGALEKLAQLAYWSAAMHIASSYREDDGTISTDADLTRAVFDLYEDVADHKVTATGMVDGSWRQANARQLRRYLELIETGKAQLAGTAATGKVSPNSSYKAKFTAIVLCVQRTLVNEPFSAEDCSNISVNPTAIVRLNIDGVAVGCVHGLDDYAMRAKVKADAAIAGQPEEEELEELDDDSDEE